MAEGEGFEPPVITRGNSYNAKAQRKSMRRCEAVTFGLKGRLVMMLCIH